MSTNKFVFKGNFSFIPDPPDGVIYARLMTAEEQTCGCGCQDIERGPAADLTYYAEPTMRRLSAEIIDTVQIMDKRGNQPSEIVWEIAVHGSRDWNLSERARLAWQILRGKG